MQEIRFRLRVLLSMLVLIVLVGTLGFMLLEKFSLIDALYFTVATITTVGYGDIHPATEMGKLLAVLLILTGVGVFLGVVANATELMLSQREQQRQHEKTQTVIGVFFREIGEHLLNTFSRADQQIDALRPNLLVGLNWGAKEFRAGVAALPGFKFRVAPEHLDWTGLRAFLAQRNDLLLRLLENPGLQEREQAADLLHAVFHLADELGRRKNFKSLPAADQEHLAGDIQRAYSRLVPEWLKYLQAVKQTYPYLFSLAVRMNPFDPKASAVFTSGPSMKN